LSRRVVAFAAIALTLLCAAAPASFAQKKQQPPKLYPGQILFYQIDFSISRDMRTQSRVAAPQLPPATRLNSSGLLQVEVAEVSANGMRLKTFYSERGQGAATPQESGETTGSHANADIPVEVSIALDGAASKIKGYEDLSTAQQLAWTDWLGRFTSIWAFPKGGIHAGQKWQLNEPETTPSPIAGLVWSKKFEYVRDERCVFTNLSSSVKPGSQKPATNPDVCAVILIRSSLRQKSSPKNATPEDYRAQNLKTTGTAAGENQTILYLSRATGLLVRSTEEAQQAMDVIVALTDGSNEVRNILSAKSRSEIRLLPDSPQEAH
jgi:hypothetical protein